MVSPQIEKILICRQDILTSINTVSIVRVNDEDKTLCVLVVVSPERSDLVLTPYVPDGETNVLVLYGLHVETCQGTDQKVVSIFELSCNP